jgi:hypothetical protein
MFLDPTRYVVLDRRLAGLASAETPTLFKELKLNPTSIPVNRCNLNVYQRWCTLRVETARNEFQGQGIIAVDVERGIFHLAQTNPEKAASLVAALERCYLRLRT